MEASLHSDIRTAYLFLDMISSIPSKSQPSKKFEINLNFEKEKNTKEILDCCICFENLKKREFVKLNCSHEFCNGCLKNMLLSDNRAKPCCAYCRTEVSTITTRTEKIYNEMMDLII